MLAPIVVDSFLRCSTSPILGDEESPVQGVSPGEWQSLRIWFQAPRFDASGKMVARPKVLRVLLNETPVQENVTLPGPTVSHLDVPEAAVNPIMLPGDHGPVAYRNLYIKEWK